MKMIWHIMKKDFRAIWPLWLAWMGLIALKVFLLYFFLNHAEARAFSLLPVITGCGVLADVIVVAGLVRSMVHEDGPVGDSAAWVTRPISGGQLIVAKLLNASLICIASPLALLIPTWLVFGCDGADMVRVLVYHGLLNGGVMLAAFAFAVTTKPGNSFWLVVVASVIAVALIATGVEQGFRFRLIYREAYWQTLSIGIFIVLLGIVWQYKQRWVRVTRSVFGVLLVVTGIMLPSSSGKSLFETAAYKLAVDTSAQVSWRENKLILSDKKPGYVKGEIEVLMPATDVSPRLKYKDGLWYGANGQTERPEWRDEYGWNEPYESGWSNRAYKIVTNAEQYRYMFPIMLSAPRFDDKQPATQVGFSGLVHLSFWQTKKVAETRLAAGQAVRNGNFFARVVSIKTYEKAIETKTVEAGVGAVGSAVTLSIENLEGSKWYNKTGNGGNMGMLLWVSIRSHQSTFTPREFLSIANWSSKDRGAQTDEVLKGDKWRISWTSEEPVRFQRCELKAERLEIAKE